MQAGHQKSIEQLREENDCRWNRLQELYQRRHQQQSSQSPPPSRSLDELLQIEIDMLPRSNWVVESEKLLNRLEAGPITGDHEYAAEVVQSYHDLRQLNSILRQDIAKTRESLNKMQVFREETKEIHTELEAEVRIIDQTTARQQKQSQGGDESLSILNNEKESINSDAHKVNHKLRMDLRYVTERINAGPESTTATATATTNGKGQDHSSSDELWSLEHLLLQLIDLLLSVSPPLEDEHPRQNGHHHQHQHQHPYLSIDAMPVRKEHVELLMRHDMVETHENDETLIRLLDYRR